MKNLVTEIHYVEKQEQELSQDEAELLAAAKKATFTSYSAYSHFSVGAAL